MVFFYVVQFSKDKTIEVVPDNWLFDNKTKCNWPPGVCERVKLTNLILKGADPIENPRINWKTYDCEVLLGTDDYTRAKIAAARAAKTSEFHLTDEETTPTQNRVLRHQVQKQRLIFHRSKSPVSDPETNTPGVNPTAKDSQPYQSTDSETNLGIENIFQGAGIQIIYNQSEDNQPGSFQDLIPPGDTWFAESESTNQVPDKLDHLLNQFQGYYSEFQNFEKLILEKLVKLSKEIDHISLTLGRHLTVALHEEDLGLPVGIKFPLTDASCLATMQHWLQNAENLQKLCNYLRGIGGSDLKDCVNRILERLFSPEFARIVNFSGLNKKICFKSHHLRSCVIAAVRPNSQSCLPTEADIDKRIQRWFGGSGDRNGGRAARKKQGDGNKTVEDPERSENLQ